MKTKKPLVVRVDGVVYVLPLITYFAIIKLVRQRRMEGRRESGDIMLTENIS